MQRYTFYLIEQVLQNIFIHLALDGNFMEQLSPISQLQRQADLLRMEMAYEQEAYSRSLSLDRLSLPAAWLLMGRR